MSVAAEFKHYFNDGGLTGGTTYSTDSLLHWRSHNWRESYYKHAGDFQSGKFCLAVMQLKKPESRRNPEYKGTQYGVELVPWENVQAMFLTQKYFQEVKEVYLQTKISSPNIISWEDFCQKVILVEDKNEFLGKFRHFLLSGRRQHA